MSERTPAQDALRRSRDALVDALEAAGAKLRGNSCRCPFHDDKNASAGIFKSKKDGNTWLFTCNGCGEKGDVFYIRSKVSGRPVGDELADARGEGSSSPAKREPAWPTHEALIASYGMPLEASHPYIHPDTNTVELLVLRFRDKEGKKQIRQSHFNGDGWVKSMPAGLLPIYNRAAIRTAERVVVVEGEKCADAMAKAGYAATTAPLGAGKGYKADWRPLAGKECILWRDNDAAGDAHMKDVARILEQLNPPSRILWLDPEELGLGEKEDVADYLAPCTTAEQRRVAVESALALATTVGGADDLWDRLKDTVDGKRRSLPMPWSYLTLLSRALAPGTVTCVCGDPASGKSLLTLHLAWALHEKGHKVALWELEDDKGFHLNRVLAQVAEQSEWTDDKWVEDHPGELVRIRAQHGEFLDSFGPSIEATEDEEPNYADLLKWIQERCEAGAEVLIIDPITAAAGEGKPWVEDRQFIMAAKAIVRRFGARLILVTHPKLGSKPGTALHSMAGGAAFPRFAHTVLWIHTLDESRQFSVQGPYGVYTVTANRTAKIGKARNGPGTGSHLAFTLDGRSLQFVEHGVIVKDEKGAANAREMKASIANNARLNAGPGRPVMVEDPFGVPEN